MKQSVSVVAISTFLLAAVACGERPAPEEMGTTDVTEENETVWDDELETRAQGEEPTDGAAEEDATDDDATGGNERGAPAGGANTASTPAGVSGGRAIGRSSTSGGSSNVPRPSAGTPSRSTARGTPVVGQTGTPTFNAPGSTGNDDATPATDDNSTSESGGSDTGDVEVPALPSDTEENASPSAGSPQSGSEGTQTYDDGWAVVYEGDPEPLVVVDDLAEPDDWFLFEQIIPFRPECYRTGLAEASVAEVEGRTVLALTANAQGSLDSNHALLGRYITSDPVVLGRQRLSLQARVDGSGIDQTQTGPEMSVQITAQMSDGSHRTAVFGLQYVAPSGTWQVLTGSEDKEAWSVVSNERIVQDVWYTIELEFDTATNRYGRLRVTGPNSVLIDAQIDGLGTRWQDKGADAPATWVTVDAENLFTCDEPAATTATIYYTGLTLTTLD